MNEANAPAALVTFRVGLARKKGWAGYVPFVQHSMMPVPMPVRGAANLTRAEAEERVRECLANPTFTAGWVVSADRITEVTR